MVRQQSWSRLRRRPQLWWFRSILPDDNGTKKASVSRSKLVGPPPPTPTPFLPTTTTNPPPSGGRDSPISPQTCFRRERKDSGSLVNLQSFE